MLQKPIALLLCLLLPIVSAAAIDTSSISAGTVLILDSSTITNGGLEQGNNNRALLEVFFNIDTGSLFSAASSNIFISGQAFRGTDAGSNAGVLQAFSNIDADPFTEIYDFWYQGTFKDNLRVKVGQVDANKEFTRSEQAGFFMHSSMGYSPTILSLPTYPDPAFSVNAFYSINPLVSVNLGFYDAGDTHVFDEVFTITEVTIRYNPSGSLTLGYWRDSNSTETLTGEQLSSTHGYFSVLDQTIPLPGGKSELGLFLQFGDVKNNISAPRQHLGAGLVWHVPFGIAAASTGIGVSALRLSDVTHAEIGNSREVAIELFYAYAFTDFLTLKPTLNYIIDPSAYPSLDNVSIFTLRTEIQF